MTQNLEQIYSVATNWLRGARSYEDGELRPSDLIWFGKVVAIGDEWRATLRERLPELARCGTVTPDEAGLMEDVLRWDVQEPGLRLLSVSIGGMTWVVALADYGSLGTADDHLEVSDPIDELALDVVERFDRLIADIRRNASFETVTRSLGPIFRSTCTLLAASETLAGAV